MVVPPPHPSLCPPPASGLGGPWPPSGQHGHQGLAFPGSVDPSDQKKTACYDIDVEVDDPLKAQMSNFLASTTNQQEIASLDVKVGPNLLWAPSEHGQVSGISVYIAPWDGT